MEKVSFFESFIKVLNVITSVPLFIEIFILTLLLMIAMIIFYFKKTKIGKKTTVIIYIVTLILLPITHISFFIQSIDKMVENFVEIVYFPSIYAYIFMLIVSDIFLLKRLLSKSEKKWYVALEFVYFFIVQFLFFLALRIVITNSINIFDKASIYYNQNLTSVVQILSYLFWIRVGILLVKLVINKITGFESNKNKTQEPATKEVISDNESFSQNTFAPVPDIYGSSVPLNTSSGELNNLSTTNDYDINTTFNISDTNDVTDNNIVDESSINSMTVVPTENKYSETPVSNNSTSSDLNINNSNNVNSSSSFLMDDDSKIKSDNLNQWESSKKLNDLISADNISQSQNNTDSMINNLNVSSNISEINTNYSVNNNYTNETFNNKTNNNNLSSISSIQSSNNYDVTSVLSNITANNNINTDNNNKVENNNSNLHGTNSLTNDNNDNKQVFFDDFYD